MKTIMMFSGRFDKPHSGHIATIQSLGLQYDTVIVCVLNYPHSNYSIEFRMSVLRDALMHSKGDYIVMSNNVHFGEITPEDIAKLPMFTHYGAGNMAVLKHMRKIFKKMGIDENRAVYVERYPGYAASEEKD